LRAVTSRAIAAIETSSKTDNAASAILKEPVGASHFLRSLRKVVLGEGFDAFAGVCQTNLPTPLPEPIQRISRAQTEGVGIEVIVKQAVTILGIDADLDIVFSPAMC
jgi:hypothetical protein